MANLTTGDLDSSKNYARTQWYHPDNVKAPWRTGTLARCRTVAAKVPDIGIVRAIDPRGGARTEELVEAVLRHVGSLRKDVEWTGYTYGGFPHYLRDLPGPNIFEALPKAGVYLFRWAMPPDENYIGSTVFEGEWLGPIK